MTKYKHEFVMRGSGDYVNETAGETLGEHKLVYRGVDGYWYLADADAAATMPVLGITMSTIVSGRKGEVLLQGYIGDTSWTWTGGSEVYASTTPGELTQTAPSGVGDIVQVVAIAVDANIIQFQGNVGAGQGGSRTLEGETAFVGFDTSKSGFVNYFVCDGTADDVQINQAEAYVVGLGGGSVMMEAGDYDISDTVTITGANVSLIGQGVESTTLTLSNNADVDMIDFAANYGYPKFSNFTMDGNKNNNASGNGFNSQGFDGLYENLNIRNFSESGVYMPATAGVNNVFREVDSQSNDEHGFLIEQGDTRLINSRASSNGLSGVKTSDSVMYVLFCSIFGNTEHGIHSIGGTCVISENNIGENKQHGVLIDGSSASIFEFIINDNIIRDNSDEGAGTYDGINMSGGGSPWVTEGLINGNQITGDHRYGVNIGSGCRRIRVDNNSISECDTANIYVDSDDHQITDNNLQVSPIGVSITANADNIRVFGNWFRNTTVNLQDLGSDTSTPEIPVNVADPDSTIGDHPAIICTDSVDNAINFGFTVPIDFQELVSAEILFVPDATGNLRHSSSATWGKIASGEAYNAGTDTIAIATLAVDQDDVEVVDISAGLTGVSIGDRVGYEWTFEGADGSNTVGGYFLGVRVRYV